MNDTNDDDAALWASRLDDGHIAADDNDLRQWLDGDRRRAGALLRAEACLAQVRRLRATVADDEPAPVDVATPRRRMIGGFLAGGLAVAATIAGVFLWPTGGTPYDTAVGEVRRVPLADGSIASINTASSLHVSMDNDRRHVVLERGEAWFQVAHDGSRPFVVEAGPIEVRAVGTAFAMRRRTNGVEVLVTEGVIEARMGGSGPGSTVRVAAGEEVFLSADGKSRAPAKKPQDIERALAWRHGELALEGQTLGEAAAEIIRYNVAQISVDPALADRPLVGYFRTNAPVSFARTAALLNDADVVVDGQTIRIDRKSPPVRSN